MVSTVSYSQDEIIKNILALHCEPACIDVDPTYSKGNFYKNIPKPTFKYDIDPQSIEVDYADARKIPLPDESVTSIMFDPPFIGGSKGKGKDGVIKKRFGIYKNVPELWDFYAGSIAEFYRILKPKGTLIFKCQDTVEHDRNYFSHVHVMNMAVKSGLFPKDLFILLSKNRLIQSNLKKQVHARKYHSYFWVFKKQKINVSYNL